MTHMDPNSLKNLRPIKKGETRNPGGVPHNLRNRINNIFLTDLVADFKEHGKDAICMLREEDPGKYISIIASLLPKEATLNVNTQSALDDLTLEQLVGLIAGLEQLSHLAGAREITIEQEADTGELSQLH